MKFMLPDGDGFQEITFTDGDHGAVRVDMVSKEDVTEIIEANKKAQLGAAPRLGKGTQTSAEHLARLSCLQAHMLMQSGEFWDDNALRKWCNDLDNELWRIRKKTRRGNGLQNPQANTGQA